VVQVGLRARADEREIPSTSLRAGSSLRLKNGYAQDDKAVQKAELHHDQAWVNSARSPALIPIFGTGPSPKGELYIRNLSLFARRLQTGGMKSPISALRYSFFSENREALTTKLTTAAAYVVLTMLLAMTAFAEDYVTIVTTSLPNATVGAYYSGTVTAVDGCTPYTWSIVKGSLPPGLSAKASSTTTSITVSGTPTGAGSNTFEVRVIGCGGRISRQTYTVQIQQPYTVNLNWDASTSPDISGYNVYRSTTSNGPYSEINTGGLVAGTTYADSTVASGTTYYYVTTAVNSSDQQSTYSTQITVQIP
jgi:hypothetical protein